MPRVLTDYVAVLPMTYYERNLPHWQPEGKAIFLTWRLYGSLPKRYPCGTATPACAGTKRTGKSSGVTDAGAIIQVQQKADWGRKFRIVDAELDRASHGPLWLRVPEISGYVGDALIRGAELGHYDLHAWVIMPNHVHVLLDPRVPLWRITRGLKGVSGRDANATLGRVGKPFWQDESFDHWIRDSSEFERIRSYIERNPVKASLAKRPQDWAWSSEYE